MKWLHLTVCACLLAGASARAADEAPGRHAIASAHPLATEAGFEILARGGNAFDAAVAVTAALAVVEPYSSGLGGGGFYLLHRAKDGRRIMLDARETAPNAADADMYLDDDGEVVPRRSKQGALAAGIPGIPAALAHLAERYGRLPLAESLAPAIRYAEAGFEVGEHYRKMAEFRLKLLQQYPAAAAVFLQDGRVPDTGYRLIQADLAKTLTRIAENGRDGFYGGQPAKTMVEAVRDNGGIWRMEDLEQYRVVEREPVRGEYRGMEITAAALPSSGGIVLQLMLNILDTFEMSDLSETERVHVLVEAMRRAYRDRAAYLGDADFVEVPVGRLLDPHYAAGLAAGIRLDRAMPSRLLPGSPADNGGEDTTHFSVIDADGNRVSATLSINFPFGSGYMPAGSGVILNNEMDDFAVKAGVPNAYGLIAGEDNPNSIEPGKRMLSSMTPTFLEKDGRIAAVGTPGGSRIITMVLLATLRFYEGGSADDMVSLSRFHHQFLPDVITYEPEAFGRDLRLELQMRGHRLRPASRRYGDMQAVIWDKKKGEFDVASDPRGQGLAAARALKSEDAE